MVPGTVVSLPGTLLLCIPRATLEGIIVLDHRVLNRQGPGGRIARDLADLQAVG